MSKLVRDAWVLLGLAFAQMFLTFLLAFVAPFAYLVSKSENEEQIKVNLQEMTAFAEANSESELTMQEILNEKGTEVRQLMEAVPWTAVAILASILLYPFLGWWSGRLLYHPQMGGLLVLGSVLTQQNVVMVPHNIEYWNMARVSLTLPLVLFLILFQFILFTVGMLAQQGQKLLEESDT